MKNPIKIVVIGGGFAGLNLIMKLQNDSRYYITLVDHNNYNFFPPLLYQVATGFLEPSSISYPFRRFLRNKKNIRFKTHHVLAELPLQAAHIVQLVRLIYQS